MYKITSKIYKIELKKKSDNTYENCKKGEWYALKYTYENYKMEKDQVLIFNGKDPGSSYSEVSKNTARLYFKLTNLTVPFNTFKKFFENFYIEYGKEFGI